MQIAPTKVRGSLGSINQLVICIGIVAALVVNVVIPATSWRTMFYLASIPPILLALGADASTIFFFVDTPHGLTYDVLDMVVTEIAANKHEQPQMPSLMREKIEGMCTLVAFL